MFKGRIIALALLLCIVIAITFYSFDFGLGSRRGAPTDAPGARPSEYIEFHHYELLELFFGAPLPRSLRILNANYQEKQYPNGSPATIVNAEYKIEMGYADFGRFVTQGSIRELDFRDETDDYSTPLDRQRIESALGITIENISRAVAVGNTMRTDQRQIIAYSKVFIDDTSSPTLKLYMNPKLNYFSPISAAATLQADR